MARGTGDWRVGLLAAAAFGALVLVAVLAAACAKSEVNILPVGTPTPDPQKGDCRPTIAHVGFEVTLPNVFPEGVRLVEACTHPQPGLSGIPQLDQAEFTYKSADESADLTVATAHLEVRPQDRPTIDVSGLTGYVSDTARQDGSRIYSIEFAKGVRAYTVIAILGPANQITQDDIKTVADSIATGTPILP